MKFWKKLLVFIFFIIVIPFAASALPQLAVLNAVLSKGIDPTASPLVTAKIEEAFVNSGGYTVLDRANVDQVLKEKEFQLSTGLVKTEEVRQAGEYLGADFVVIATVSRIGQTYVISAKMVDVLSGEIRSQASDEKQGKIDVLLSIAKNVGKKLAGAPVAMPQKEKKKPEKTAAEIPAEKKKEKKAAALQPPSKKKTAKDVIGFKGGINFATVNLEALSGREESMVMLIAGGAYFTFNLSHLLAVQLEASYQEKGVDLIFANSYPYNSTYYTETDEYKFSYLELPILVKLTFTDSPALYVIAGASAAFSLSGEIYIAFDDSTLQSDYDNTYTNPVEITDLAAIEYSGIAGIGADIVLGNLLINIEARYTLGLSNLVDSSSVVWNNSFISITSGIGFAF